MRYLITNFQKSQALETFLPQRLVNLRLWWLEVAWFSQKWFFERIMAKSNFKKTVMTSFQWRHCYYDTKNVTKLTSHNFSILGPLPIKISVYASALLSHFMVLTSLNTYVAVKTRVCIRLLKAHLPFFSPGQWKELCLIERFW